MVEAGARGLAWTRATLDAFLDDPLRVVPGTEMGMPGPAGADDRRAVIDYLERAGGSAAASPRHAPPAGGRHR
jgi:cytochrome c2